MSTPLGIGASLLDLPAGAPATTTSAPSNGAPAVGSSLIAETPPANGKKPRKPKAPKEPKPEVTGETRVLPAPKPPSEVEVVKAEAQVAAAQALGGREMISKEIMSVFEAEEQALAAVTGEGEVLTAALAAHEALLSEHDRRLAAKLQAFVIDTAMVGHAIEEVKFWEAEAERIKRLYEAYRIKAEQRAERAHKALWPWIQYHCDSTPRAEGRKSWSFPTTTWVVMEREDHTGRLEVTDHRLAASALQKLVGPEVATKAIKVEWFVYVKESKAILDAAKISPSSVNGFRWTAPGAKSMGIERGR